MNFDKNFKARINTAKDVTILTGAGVSAESGIATFRDPDGLWSKFNPAELASIDGFLANTELVWSWYRHRVSIIENTSPNPGHYAIAEIQKLIKSFNLITQNVDRLHQRAGSENVIELHGNIVNNHCFDCGDIFEGNTSLLNNILPKCVSCGGRIRPDVVWFGEMLPQQAIKKAEIAAIKADIFFIVGTSSEVYPAANLPIIAKQNGAFVVEVNPKQTAISNYMDYCIRETSAVAFPQILEFIKTTL